MVGHFENFQKVYQLKELNTYNKTSFVDYIKNIYKETVLPFLSNLKIKDDSKLNLVNYIHKTSVIAEYLTFDRPHSKRNLMTKLYLSMGYFSG